MPQPTPPLIVIGFGSGAGPDYIQNPIPVASQIPTNPGRASYTDGFPPQTMTPESLGGTAMLGPDLNGVLEAVSANIAALTGGQWYPFNATWASTNAGYAVGAIVSMANGTGVWINLTAGNTNNPDTFSPASGSGWAPLSAFGSTSAVTTGGASVLPAAVVASDFIVVGGTLTSNAQLVFPTWVKSWTIFNLTTGAFSLTCTTQSGTGIMIPQGGFTYPVVICGDSINILQISSPLGNVILNPPGAGLQTISGPLELNALNPFLSLWNTGSTTGNRNWTIALTATQLNITAVSDDFSTASLGIQFIRSGVNVTQVNLGGTSQTGTTQAPSDNSTNFATTSYVTTAVATLSQAVGSTAIGYQPSGVSGIGTGYTAIIADIVIPPGVYAVAFDGDITGSGSPGSFATRVIIGTGTGAGSPVATIGGGVNYMLNSSSAQNQFFGNAAGMTGAPIFNSTQHAKLSGTFTMPAGATSVTFEFATSSGTLAVGAGSYVSFLRLA